MLDLVSLLDARRFRSVVLLPSTGWLHEQIQQFGVPTVLARSKAWYDLHLLRAMETLARREKVDLIHSHLPDQNFYSCVVARLTGCKIVVTYHGLQQLHKADGAKVALKLWAVKRSANAVVAVSDYLKNALEEAGFSSEKVVRIHNGVEADRFAGAGHGSLRSELRCSNGTRLVGMVANIRESKGYEYFIRAARLVTDSIPQAHFVAIGEIDPAIGSGLFSLRRELGLENQLSFLGFRSDVDRLLGDLDVFVLSSVSEGFSLATIEAMAAGRPVVATRSGGPEEVVEDGTTGLLVPVGDARSLATKICEVLKNNALACALGKRAQAIVRSKFSLTKMVEDYTRVYERCLSAA